jgi:hypothetical protein
MKVFLSYNLESDWARLGALFSVAPSDQSPDPEQVLIRTASAAEDNARVLPLAVTWLVEYGEVIARHRLRHLAASTLSRQHQAVLALIIESALAHGASKRLANVLDVCHPAPNPAPLSRSFRSNPRLAAIAERTASPESKRWGVWAPPVTLKRDAIRPLQWVLAANPEFHNRFVRHGDLRCSVLITLQRDVGSQIQSESALARHVGATRAGLRKALDALVHEGAITRLPRAPHARDRGVALASHLVAPLS